MFSPSHRIWVLESFLDPPSCRTLLQSIQRFRRENELAEIYRPAQDRDLRYFVINGRQIAESFPELRPLYAHVQSLAEEKSGLKLQLMKNEMVGININITPPGGEYRWHYDRNAVTAIIFLNEVAGGETEVYPGYRIKLKNKKHSRIQEKLDRLLMTSWIRVMGRKLSIEPQVGKMLLMRGDECLHSVRRVEGSEERINILFSYEHPGAENPQEDALNSYLYTDRPASHSDPNYL